jgi:hypothetical protein
VLCIEADAAMGPPVLSPENSLLKMFRNKDGSIPGSERGTET